MVIGYCYMMCSLCIRIYNVEQVCSDGTVGVMYIVYIKSNNINYLLLGV